MFRNILVAIEDSDLSITAGMRVVPLAKLAGANMTVVFVQDTYPFTGIGESNAAGVQALMATARHEGLSAIARISRAAAAEGGPAQSVVVDDHEAAKGIVDAAASGHADLIVMGSHGRSGLAKVVLGSVSAKVLEMSPVPVLVIKRATPSTESRSPRSSMQPEKGIQ